LRLLLRKCTSSSVGRPEMQALALLQQEMLADEAVKQLVPELMDGLR
jgi:hypothetical protein